MLAVFDRQYCQPSYWFTSFLMMAEHARVLAGESNIELVFEPGVGGPCRFGKFKRWPNTEAELNQCFRNIVIPMTSMLPSITSMSFLIERDPSLHVQEAFILGNSFVMERFVHAYAAGIRPLRTSPVKKVAKRVTITLRECGDRHWKARDSNVPEWVQAAKYLKDEAGYDVIVVRDTRMACEFIPGLQIHPHASLDLRTRAELYASSAANLFVNNGPAWLALAMDVPVLMFKPVCDNAGKSHGHKGMAAFGFIKDQQIPNAPKYQRLVWKEDQYQTIVQETLQFMADNKC